MPENDLKIRYLNFSIYYFKRQWQLTYLLFYIMPENIINIISIHQFIMFYFKVSTKITSFKVLSGKVKWIDHEIKCFTKTVLFIYKSFGNFAATVDII